MWTMQTMTILNNLFFTSYVVVRISMFLEKYFYDSFFINIEIPGFDPVMTFVGVRLITSRLPLACPLQTNEY